jgi:hypothetical protein
MTQAASKHALNESEVPAGLMIHHASQRMKHAERKMQEGREHDESRMQA